MPKALILANSSSGLYDFRNELLTGLMDEGYEIVISLPDELKVKELKDEGCRVVHTDINRRGVNPIQDMALLRAYKSLIKKEKPDVVITYTIKPNIYGGYVCRRLKVPYVSTITGLGTTFERGGVLLKLIVAMYKISLKKCSCLFFQNDENRKIFESHGIRAVKHVTVNGSGVNLDKHTKEAFPGGAEGEKEAAVKLSDRHFGIGGDGIIIIKKGSKADFEMVMYNADGSRSQMCGNGVRCVGKLVYDAGCTKGREFTVESMGAVKVLTVVEGKRGDKVTKLSVDMGKPILEAEKIPVDITVVSIRPYFL